MKNQRILIIVLTLALLLIVAVGLSQAQGPGPDSAAESQEPLGPAAAVSDEIPIQGRLTDASGSPISGTRTITFTLYDSSVGGTAVCQDVDAVNVVNGLFSARMGYCTASDINGQQLYLGIQVEGDPEMLDRQAILPVPYAWSLRPGADIVGDFATGPVLYAENSDIANASSGIFGRATGASGTTYGVTGVADSPDGRGVYGYAESGKGVYGLSSTGYGGYFASTSGVAIRATGSGIIQSAANSYLWISGNGLQKSNSDDTTRFVYDLYGGYKVYGGTDWGTNKTVVLPVTIPGQLYGQNVTVTGMDLYYTISSDLTGIDIVAVRRQNGVNAGDTILYDNTDLVCAEAQCVQHWNLTQNNVLSDQQGILHIALRLGFSGEAAYVHIGGVRLTLEHD